MDNLFNHLLEDYTYVLERYTFACRNYHHHSATSDYVRHRTLSQDLIHRPYLVTVKDIRNLSQSIFRVGIDTFSTNGVIV